jgi:hypothetical protein
MASACPHGTLINAASRTYFDCVQATATFDVSKNGGDTMARFGLTFSILLCALTAHGQPIPFELADFNGDSLLDCGDIDLLSLAITSGQHDPTFDLDDDQRVTFADLGVFLSAASHARGFEGETVPGDITLDGVVNHLDANIMSLRWHQEASSWCHPDFEMDGIVDSGDKAVMDINWQQRITPYEFVPASVDGIEIPPGREPWSHTDGVPFAQVGPYELLAIPQRAPDGVMATKVVFRTINADERIATFYHLEISGDLHQTWLAGPFGVPTAKGLQPGPTYHQDWIAYDSHLFIDHGVIGVSMGHGFTGVSETNDGSNPVSANEVLPEIVFGGQPSTGMGDLTMVLPSDTFFLRRDAQSNTIDFAYLVTPARIDGGDDRGRVYLTLGVMGGDSDDQPLPDVGVIGLEQPLEIPFFAEPCDFDASGTCDVADLNQILFSLGTEQPLFDLDPTSPLIDLADRDAWLSDAAIGEFNGPFLVGDTNLDGAVDSADLNALSLNWLVSGAVGWADGDFNGDDTVSAVDLNSLALNWRKSNRAGGQAVPEPATLQLLIYVMPWLSRRLRNEIRDNKNGLA